MRIALLKTDYVNAPLLQAHGDLPDMFSRFFNEARDTTIDVFEVRHGDLPRVSYACDAFVISGSRYSVNDDKPWISDLIAFVQARARTDIFVGICFGHQLLAKAFNARVERNERGPNVGARALLLRERPDWAKPFHGAPSALFNHSEQVVSTPDKSMIIAGDSICSIQIMQCGPLILGIQAHPEYTTAYQEDLMRLNKGLSSASYMNALARNRCIGCNNSLIREWILSFIDRGHEMPAC